MKEKALPFVTLKEFVYPSFSKAKAKKTGKKIYSDGKPMKDIYYEGLCEKMK